MDHTIVINRFLNSKLMRGLCVTEAQRSQILRLCFQWEYSGSIEKLQQWLQYVPGLVDAGVDKHYPSRVRRLRSSGQGSTKLKMLYKYGKVEGSLRWEQYRQKHSTKNTLQAKQEKYGWSVEEFKEYNQNRAVTYDNLITRHGVEKGAAIWNNYCVRQGYTNTKEYSIEKYGELEGLRKWRESSLKKGVTMKNYVRIYGQDQERKLEERMTKLGGSGSYSKSSQKLFRHIEARYPDLHCYFAEKNIEFGKYCHKTKSYRKYDFVAPEIKLSIEYHGDHWHANPAMYSPSEIPKMRGNTLTARELWQKDRDKKELIESLGFRLLVVWESEFNRQPDAVMEKIYNEIDRNLILLGRRPRNSRN